MHEARKIREAEFFLHHMRDARDNEVHFGHFLSAFLTASRSALEYAQRECRPAGRVWFDGEIRKHPVIEFLRKSRNWNVHHKPTETRHLRGVMTSPGWIKLDPLTGQVLDGVPPGPMRGPFTLRIDFEKWTGPEDAQELCEHCIQQIKAIVAEGVAKGFLRPER